MIKISDWHNSITDQKFVWGNKRWLVTNLIEKSKDLPVQEMPLEHLNIYGLHPEIKSMRNWVGNIKNVLGADLSIPIILDDDGYVMDGRHRIAKALLDEEETIKFVRFDETPKPDYIEGKESE